MKNIIRTLALLLLFTAGQAQAQHDKKAKFAAVDIHSNAVCDMCQTTIETEMLYVKGVRAVKLELESNTIHVDYKAKKTNPDKLRRAVADLGYMADNLMPDPEARKALPECCQAEGCGMPEGGMKEAAKSATPATEPLGEPVSPAVPSEPATPQH